MLWKLYSWRVSGVTASVLMPKLHKLEKLSAAWQSLSDTSSLISVKGSQLGDRLLLCRCSLNNMMVQLHLAVRKIISIKRK